LTQPYLVTTEMRRGWRDDAPVYLAGAAAVTSVVSIAAFEILLGLAFLSLLMTGRLRRPPLLWPVLCWIAWTVVSLAASGHARGGLPQIKKLYLFLMLVVVYSAIRTLKEVRFVVLGWTVAAAMSGAWGLQQFARKYRFSQLNHSDFYRDYIASRITGFMDHWMTFSGHMMMALMLIGAMLLFSREGLKKWLLPAAAIVGVALLAADTRSMWGGAAAGAIYLLWCRKRWLVATLPVFVAIVFALNPIDLRERMISIVHPRADLDSNEHRALLRRVGWEMIKAHPLLGVGVERVGPEFERYVPTDVPRPLPNGYYGHLHNIYFHYAAERGVPALAAILWLFGQALWSFHRALRDLPQGSEARWVLHAAVAVIIAVMLGGYFEVNLGDSEVQAMFLAVLACGYVATDKT
jgi:putative inorganic carbon (HCO3(-)) transporter